MKRRTFLSSTAALVFLAACGLPVGEHPTDTLLFPGATPVDINAAALAAELQGGIDQYLTGLPKPSRMQLYRIPNDSTYVAVKAFYGDGLTPLGWAPFTNISVEGDTLSYTAWRKGVNIIVIGVVENVANDGAYLLVVGLP